jgi:hypothetical protein
MVQGGSTSGLVGRGTRLAAHQDASGAANQREGPRNRTLARRSVHEDPRGRRRARQSGASRALPGQTREMKLAYELLGDITDAYVAGDKAYDRSHRQSSRSSAVSAPRGARARTVNRRTTRDVHDVSASRRTSCFLALLPCPEGPSGDRGWGEGIVLLPSRPRSRLRPSDSSQRFENTPSHCDTEAALPGFATRRQRPLPTKNVMPLYGARVALRMSQ